METSEIRYLQRLAELYPTIGKASAEIINLQSILNLPKRNSVCAPHLHRYNTHTGLIRCGMFVLWIITEKMGEIIGAYI